MASSIRACIPSCQKCCHFGKYCSSKEWKTSNEPVWWKPVNFLMCRNGVFCSITLRKALWSTLPDLSNFLLRSSPRDNVGCKHFGNNALGSLSHSWTLDIWYNTIDFHFSTSNSASPIHVWADHHKWLKIKWIHGKSWPQCFALAFLPNFFVTLLAKCHTSYWWSMWG